VSGKPSEVLDFCGQWKLDREITDQKNGQKGVLNGKAEFEPVGQSVQYIEFGSLTYGGQPKIPASRRYLWSGHSGGINVFFDNGIFFHHVHLGLSRTEAVHICAEDIYKAFYDFTTWPVWSTTWNVSGPRKHYTMRSTYFPFGDVV